MALLFQSARLVADMSYAKKTNGYRGITVKGTRYRWCFRSDAQDSTVTLQGTESGGQQAVAILRDCPDPWITFPAATRWVLVTPKIVRQMIEQALARGWNPTRRAAPVTFYYEPDDHAE
jgi:hypothetical protein